MTTLNDEYKILDSRLIEIVNDACVLSEDSLERAMLELITGKRPIDAKEKKIISFKNLFRNSYHRLLSRVVVLPQSESDIDGVLQKYNKDNFIAMKLYPPDNVSKKIKEAYSGDMVTLYVLEMLYAKLGKDAPQKYRSEDDEKWYSERREGRLGLIKREYEPRRVHREAWAPREGIPPFIMSDLGGDFVHAPFFGHVRAPRITEYKQRTIRLGTPFEKYIEEIKLKGEATIPPEFDGVYHDLSFYNPERDDYCLVFGWKQKLTTFEKMLLDNAEEARTKFWLRKSQN